MTFSWITRHVKTGKDFQNKVKILVVCFLRFPWKYTPNWVRKLFDFSVRYMIFVTDARFRIGAVYDFFVFSTTWEQQLTDVFQFRKGLNFLDVGAHIGRYTIRAGIKVGKDGRVISVEPDINNFRLLTQNINLNGLLNCVPLNIAAYKTNTEITLYTGKDSAKNSIKQDVGLGSKKIKGRALDSVLAEIGCETVDLIKIDVEEAEYDVLLGLQNTLSYGKPRLMVEVLKKDESKVIHYLRELHYKERLVHSDPSYKGGLMFYSFEKAHGEG